MLYVFSENKQTQSAERRRSEKGLAWLCSDEERSGAFRCVTWCMKRNRAGLQMNMMVTLWCVEGVGEQGRPYPLTDSDRVDQAYRENGFNIYVSNRIALNRSLPDIRHPKWAALFLFNLNPTSVTIPAVSTHYCTSVHMTTTTGQQCRCCIYINSWKT